MSIPSAGIPCIAPFMCIVIWYMKAWTCSTFAEHVGQGHTRLGARPPEKIPPAHGQHHRRRHRYFYD